MEDIKDFFKHINTRLSSPFVFSFIISWLICNWKVTVGLIFHDHEFLKLDGYSSYIDLISKEVNWRHGFWLPVLGASIYTLGNPFLTAIIHSVQTYFQKLEDNWNLNILKGGRISIDKYIKLRQELEDRKNTLAEVIQNESSIGIKLQQQEGINLNLQHEIAKLHEKISTSEKLLHQKDMQLNRMKEGNSSYAIVQGKWTKKTTLHGTSKEEIISIAGASYYTVEGGKTIRVANIQHYYYDEGSATVFFVISFIKRPQNGQTKALINDLKFNDVEGSLRGQEDTDIQVSYMPLKEEDIRLT